MEKASAPPLSATNHGQSQFPTQFEDFPTNNEDFSANNLSANSIGFSIPASALPQQGAVPCPPVSGPDYPVNPSAYMEPPPPSYAQSTMEYPNSEEDIRQALNEYVKSKCCAGSSAARDMKIHDIQPIHAFRYVLDTFAETRVLEDRSEPYNNQYVDGSQNGPAPDKWSIISRPTQAFAYSSNVVPLPHSASIMDCDKCHTTGYTSCGSCNGMGFKRCIWCSGTGRQTRSVSTAAVSVPMTTEDHHPHHHYGHGHHHHHGPGHHHNHHHHHHNHNHHLVVVGGQEIVENCTRCIGMGRTNCSNCEVGRVSCKTCMGHKYLKRWQAIKIKWSCETLSYETEREQLHQQLLKKAIQGGILLDERCPGNNPRPVTSLYVTDSRIIQVSSQYIAQQVASQNNDRKVLEFRQRIEIIPVVKVIFEHKGEHGSFFVYGAQRSVYFPEGYPDKNCCCCCSVM